MPRTELPISRRSFIADLAEGIWQDYSGERQVFLDGIADEFDVSLSYGHYGDAFDGLLEHKSGSFHIYCNLTRVHDQNAPRARFTVAHELGHYFIDEHRNALAAGKPPHSSFPERLSDNPVEQEANLFASHLLMPTVEFQTALTGSARGAAQGIVDIAGNFAVSIQSAALRYHGDQQQALRYNNVSGGQNHMVGYFSTDEIPWPHLLSTTSANSHWIRPLDAP